MIDSTGSVPSRTGNPPLLRRALVVAGAVVAATVPWMLALLTGTTLEVPMAGREPLMIGLPEVLIVAVLASLAGWGAVEVLRRLTRRAAAAWTMLSLAVLLASLLPIIFADISAGVGAYLAAMHLAVGVVLIPGLRATLPTPAQRSV
jgi:hypothetical protein